MGFTIVWLEGVIFGSIMTYHVQILLLVRQPLFDRAALAAHTDLMGASAINPNRKIFEARKRETAALGAGEKLVLGHPLAATIGDSARCMQNLEKVLFTGPKISDTVTFICD